MERKDLTIYRVGWDSATENYDDLKMADTLDWDAEVLLKSEADAVMDAQEARIKELEDLLDLDVVFKNQDANLRDLEERVIKLEAKIKEMGERILERNKTVCEQTERIKELEARLGTDHIVDANKMMWVSVKERMPDDAKRVLVSDNLVKKDGTIIGQYVQEASCEEGIFVDPLGYPLQHVTHWMPLPEPPKEEK